MLFVLSIDASAQEPAGTTISISGYVRSNSGNPLISRIRITLVGNFTETLEGYSNSSGYYHLETSKVGYDVYIYLYDEVWDIHAYPGTAYFTRAYGDIVQDFAVSPGVVVSTGYGATRYSAVGTQVSVNGTRVATIGDTPFAIFYPEELWLDYTGTLWFERPFTQYSPQDTEGILDTYDCRFFAIDRGGPPSRHAQTAEPRSDTPGVYSWNVPGGLGWDRFVATPDNRLPNNPNIFVRADFSLIGTWSKDDIRLSLGYPHNPIYAIADLTAGNGYVAEFAYPIGDCRRGNYRLEILFWRNGYPVWWPLAEFSASGTSDADLNGDGLLNVADAGILTAAVGTCEGDGGFVACADFIPDGCISFLQDGAAWSEVLFYGQSKQQESGPFDATVTLAEQAAEAGRFDILVDAKSNWSLALVLFSIPGDASAAHYLPPSGYADRALLVSRRSAESTEFVALAAVDGRPGATSLGTIVGLDGRDCNAVVVRYVGLQAGEAATDGTKARAIDLTARSRFRGAAPNPFNPATTMSFVVAERCRVSAAVFDVSGRLVRTLVTGDVMESGEHQLTWTGIDDSGRRVGAGVYLCRLRAGKDEDRLRLTLLK